MRGLYKSRTPDADGGENLGAGEAKAKRMVKAWRRPTVERSSTA